MAIEPPSQSLLQSLQSLHLATVADLRVCEKYTRQLVVDLPAFDSVWIDALVQGGRITPFQARVLAQDPQLLRVGSYVLVDRLPHDNWPQRYRAVPHGGDQPVALSVFPLDGPPLVEARSRFENQIAQTRSVVHRGLCLAHDVESDERSLIAVSPLPIGESLEDLLVRRGRFPADVVEEIARQTLEALAQLEQVGTLHGDLRLRNVLLGPAGRVQIINAGLLAAVYPRITIHDALPIHCYQGLAPELSGGRRDRDHASEQYALGCLLWQLLAGRPPHLPADRLDQLAAHQALTIPDVRKFAPDTPAALAALIARMVAKHPTERMTSLGAASRECGSSQARGRARLVQFQSSFQSVVPIRLGQPQRRRPRSYAQLALTVVVMLGAAITFLVPGVGQMAIDAAGRLLQARQETVVSTEPSSEKPEAAPAQVAEASPAATAPTPQETAPRSGRIILDQPIYQVPAKPVSAVGELKIIGAEGTRPVIEVSDRPLQLGAQRVILENVVIRRAAGSSVDIPLVNADCQILICRDCDFIGGRLVTAENPTESPSPAFRWRNLDESDILAAQIQLTNCLIAGGGPVLSCDSVPQTVELTDTVCVGAGAVCEVRHAPGFRTLQMQLVRSTLRSSGPLLREHEITPESQTPVRIGLRESIVDLREGIALVEAVGPLRTRWEPDLEIDSVESYLSGQSAYVGTRLEPADELNELDPSDLNIEGLPLAETVKFAGPPSTRWSHQIVAEYVSDVRGDATPGIQERKVAKPAPRVMTERTPLGTNAR
jgi:hypothetical protein